MDQRTDVANVAVAIETRIYQEGIRHMLERYDDTRLVATASNAEQVLRACADYLPDILLLDALMANALDIVRIVKKQHPNIKIIVLAISACRQEMVTFASEGVLEFLTREDSLEDLHRCIDAAMNNGFWCSSQVAELLLQNKFQQPSEINETVFLASKPAGEVASLTPQQFKILRYLESGLSNKAIARQLNIETVTVKNHVHHILRRLGVNTRGEAAATYRRESFGSETPRFS